MHVLNSSPYHKNLLSHIWSSNHPKVQNHFDLLSYVLIYSVELVICMEMESVLTYHKQECNITSSEDITTVCAVVDMMYVQYME